MDTQRQVRRASLVRVFLQLALALAIIGCVIVATGTTLHRAEPAVSEARAAAIDHDKATILAECEKAAGGDWDRWQRETAPCRDAIKAKLADAKSSKPSREPWLKGGPRVLEGRVGFPLFEVNPRETLEYLYDDQSLNQFRKDRAVVAAHRWLRRQGIDLIFIPVPKMTEVYSEHFVDPCPPDGVIGPHVRRTLLELLGEGVEVVDGLPLFRPARKPDPEYLYNAADTHWAPRAMGIMAREVAGRIRRYGFGAEARSAPPIVKATSAPFDIQLVPSSVKEGDLPRMDGWAYLTAEQKKLVEAAQTRTVPHVTVLDGREPLDDAKSPVLLIGNCYVVNFRELLIKEMNLLVRTRWAKGQTTEAFGMFLREPEVLEGCRVVVWIVSEQHLPHFYAMPPPVMQALESGE
jgi:hypothetical protein